MWSCTSYIDDRIILKSRFTVPSNYTMEDFTTAVDMSWSHGEVLSSSASLSCKILPHSVSEWILIKSTDQSQRLSQDERGPPRGPKKTMNDNSLWWAAVPKFSKLILGYYNSTFFQPLNQLAQ